MRKETQAYGFQKSVIMLFYILSWRVIVTSREMPSFMLFFIIVKSNTKL